MQFSTLQEWLAWQETLHPRGIDLGLERLRVVLAQLKFTPPNVPVITIAGTKGKGSTAAMLASLYQHAGYRTGLFTSPHLLRYNERIQVNGQMVSDAALCAVFERINQARGAVSLTYFEFNALAAFLLFADAPLDVWILEVGMGGRLDAVNVIDADVAIITSIGLDHTEWLGNDVDSIGREKAGITRAHRPLVYASPDMPNSIAEVALNLNAPLYRADRDFGFTVADQQWHWWAWINGQRREYAALPLPGISGAVQLFNASAALFALSLLQTRLPISTDNIHQGLQHVRLPGRFQTVVTTQGQEWILDVAHNAMSAEVLAQHLQSRPRRRTLGVLGVMSDKDIAGMLLALAPQVDAWLVTGLPTPRALTASQLQQQLLAMGLPVLASHEQIESALPQALASDFARVLVCGSFLSVAPALVHLGQVV